MKVRRIFKAILMINNENMLFFSIVNPAGVNPAISYTWILQIRLMLASSPQQLLHTTHTLSSPNPFPQAEHILTFIPQPIPPSP